MNNKAVLFDLDGVLVDACDWHYEALNKALKEICNYEITRSDHENKYNGLPTMVKLKLLINEGVVKDEEVNEICNLKQKFTIEFIENLCKLDSEKIEFMKKLISNGYKLGCVTNSIKETALKMLSKVGVLQYLNCVVTNEDINYSKPHPEGYITAMVILNSLPKNTIIIEDSETGLKSAKATGAKVIQVKNSTEVNKNLI